MNFELWTVIIILGSILIGLAILSWTEPNDEESVRERERALDAKRRWSA